MKNKVIWKGVIKLFFKRNGRESKEEREKGF